MTIPIFYTVDDEYTKYAEVSIHSLIKNANPNNNYNVYIILKNGMLDSSRKKLQQLETKNVKIIFKELDKELDMIPKKDVLAGNKFNLTIYFRIFIPDMFKELDKAIYLDSDTIINDDISNYII